MSSRERVKLNDGAEVTIRPMTREDLDQSLEFFRGLPNEDRASLRRDVTRREVVEDRIREMEQGFARRLVAEVNGQIVADGALELATFGWEQHVGEIRLIVAHDYQRKGLGKLMARSLYGVAAGAGIGEIIVKMMPSQTAAREIFRRLGFREETILRDYVMDAKGKKHDLIVMRCGLEELWAQFEDFVHEADLRAFRMY